MIVFHHLIFLIIIYHHLFNKNKEILNDKQLYISVCIIIVIIIDIIKYVQII